MREFILFFFNPKINGKVFCIIRLSIIKEPSTQMRNEKNKSRCHGSTDNKKKNERQPISKKKHCKNRKSTSNKYGKQFSFLVVSLKAKEVKLHQSFS